MKLLFEALIKFALGLIMIIILLFLPAGTIYYWNAWLFITLLFLPMIVVGIVLFVKNKELLKKRLNNKEKEKGQKILIIVSCILLILGLVIAGFDYRYSYSKLPLWSVVLASAILVISYLIYVEVLRENVYLSRTVEVQENQKVIDTGLYSIVRHPMYFATTLMYLSIPFVLGSWISFIVFCIFPFVLVKRIKNEEKILEDGLAGYKQYKERVKYRLIPFIW